jgi:hypothetical protein
MYTEAVVGSIKVLRKVLEDLCDPNHYLFAVSDFRSLLPDMKVNALKTLLSRAQANSLLKRVCRGIYLYDRVDYPRGLVLFHAVSRLRAEHFNYISLETALSDEGIISQIPMNRITLMSSGRSSVIDCGTLGSIEFVHTKKKPDRLAGRMKYDSSRGLWRANRELALEDIKAVGRNLDLIDWEAINDIV